MSTNSSIIKKAITSPGVFAVASADTLWQWGGQYLDKALKKTAIIADDEADYVMGNDLTAILYPVLLGLFAWQFALYCMKKSKDDKSEASSSQIGWNVCLGVAGWSMGYYLAEFHECNKWGIAAAVGAGTALPTLLMGSSRYIKNNESDTKMNITVTTACMFAVGFLWYVDSLLPHFIGGDKTTHEISKAVIAPAATFITTALGLALTLVSEKKLGKGPRI